MGRMEEERKRKGEKMNRMTLDVLDKKRITKDTKDTEE